MIINFRKKKVDPVTEERLKSLGDNIIDAILEDDPDSKYSDFNHNPNLVFKSNYKLPTILQNSPPILCVCCLFGSVKCFRTLIDLGANPFAQDELNYTAAHFVAFNGNLEIARDLFKLGLSFQKPAKVLHFHTSSFPAYIKEIYPQDIAAMNGQQELINWLWLKGCKMSKSMMIFSAAYGNILTTEFILKRLNFFNTSSIKESDNDDTIIEDAFCLAAFNGHDEMITYLLNFFPRANLKRALEEASKSGSLACVKICYEHQKESGGAGCWEGFVSACSSGHIDVVNFFITEGIEPSEDEVRTSLLPTPLEMAVHGDHIDIAEKLISSGYVKIERAKKVAGDDRAEFDRASSARNRNAQAIHSKNNKRANNLCVDFCSANSLIKSRGNGMNGDLSSKDALSNMQASICTDSNLHRITDSNSANCESDSLISNNNDANTNVMNITTIHNNNSNSANDLHSNHSSTSYFSLNNSNNNNMNSSNSSITTIHNNNSNSANDLHNNHSSSNYASLSNNSDCCEFGLIRSAGASIDPPSASSPPRFLPRESPLSLLSEASRNEDLHMVRLLVSAFSIGASSMHNAASIALDTLNFSLFKYFVDSGVSLSRLPVHKFFLREKKTKEAVEACAPFVEFFIAKGVHESEKLLLHLVLWGDVEGLKYVIERGSDLNENFLNRNIGQIINENLRGRNYGMIFFLLDNYDLKITDKMLFNVVIFNKKIYFNLLKKFVEKGISLSSPKNGLSLLYYAIINQCLEAIDLLKENGADYTHLCVPIRYFESPAFFDVMKDIVYSENDFTKCVPKCNGKDEFIIQLYCKCKNTNLLRYLLQIGFMNDINKKFDNNGSTLLDFAFINKDSEMIVFLIANGASIEKCKFSINDFQEFAMSSSNKQLIDLVSSQTDSYYSLEED